MTYATLPSRDGFEIEYDGLVRIIQSPPHMDKQVVCLDPEETQELITQLQRLLKDVESGNIDLPES